MADPGRPSEMATWRLADRTLDLDRPIGAGIVNGTVDSMYAGARSGTAEQAVAEARSIATGLGCRPLLDRAAALAAPVVQAAVAQR